jgi:SAM-dependent methyltransferase
MKYLDWDISADVHLKKMEIELHEVLHEKRSSDVKSKNELFKSKYFRIGALEKAFQKTGIKSKKSLGRVMDIGAGDGWCSAYLLDRYHVDELYVMEISESSLKKLIPSTLKLSESSLDNVNLVKGSFNEIRLTNELDIVIAMGALHHSANLYKTAKEIYKSLKPGGYLIAQEPFMSNTTLNKFYNDRANQTKDFNGLISIKNEDRTDVFYRMCEYQTAFMHAGYDVIFEELSGKKKSVKKTLKDLLSPYAESSANGPKNGLVVAQKPLTSNEVITSWES